MGVQNAPMRSKYLPLAASNYIVQLTRSPHAFASKVSSRLLGHTFNWPPPPDHRQSDFRVPIIPSPTGGAAVAPLHILTNSLPHSTGGYAIRSHQILRAQRSAGMKVSALTRIGYPVNIGRFPTGTSELQDGITYSRVLPSVFPVSFKSQVREYAKWIVCEAKRRDSTVIHATTPWPNAAAASLAARELGIPWIYEVRGEPEATWAAKQPPGSAPLRTAFFNASRSKEEEAMRAAAAVVTLSEVSADSLRKRGVVGREMIVVPNAVDEQWPAQRIAVEMAQRKLGLPPRRYIGAVSSLVEYEGFDDLICALHYLPSDVSVLLVGDGNSLSTLRKLAKAEQLEDRVVFVGRHSHDDIAKFYSALDVFVVPRKESLVTRTVTPIKTLQAQAFGIPIVASDLPALREVTGGTERYVRPGFPQGIAVAVNNALQNPAPPPPKLFTWADAAQKYRKLYEAL